MNVASMVAGTPALSGDLHQKMGTKKMKRNAILPTVIAALVLQIACGEKKTSLSPSTASVQVSVMTIQYESVPSIVKAPGTVQPRNRIALSSQINGFVREINVRTGDSVRQDQVLAMLDARDAENQKTAAQASVLEAQAALSEAQKAHQAAIDMQSAAKASAELAGQTLTRYQKLFESRSISTQEIDEVRMRRNSSAAELASRESMVAAAADRIQQAEARISQAKAQAGRADVALSWTQIKAPSSGKIVERLVDPGTAIFPGTPLLIIESTTQPQVLANIPIEQSGGLHAGMEAKIRSAEAARILIGRLSEVVPLSDPSTHSIQFKVDLPSNAALSNGQFVAVDIPVGKRNVLLIPLSAIREAGQLAGLFVVDSASRARFRLVKCTPYDATYSEILSGVEPGENIIEPLNDRITDGASVEIRQ
jgi:membrane fusion protein, multidrug efflux system